MRAISLHQPWATLIAIGAKKIETRSWDAGYTGPLAIHAAKRPVPWDGFGASFAVALHRFRADELPRGAIVAVCNLDSSLGIRRWNDTPELTDGRIIHPPELDFGDYSPGRFAWTLSNVRALRFPIPFTGRQRWFEVPDELIGPALSKEVALAL